MFLNNLYHIKEGIVPDDFCNEIIKQGESKNLEDAKIQDGDQSNRSGEVSWLDDKKIQIALRNLVTIANEESGWNFSLKEFEPLQYTVYNEGDHYDWHIDTHTKPYQNGLIRKLSFTMILNDDYKGGDFTVCNPHPISDKTKVHTFENLKKGTMIVFPSHLWHKVTKVTKGKRRVLVGWVVGTPFV